IPQSASSPVTLDGGYFGTTNTTSGFTGNPVVSLQFNGASIPGVTFTSDRQLQFNISAASPGLYPIAVTDIAAGSANGSVAAANIAVQPPGTPPASQTSIPVGTMPTGVAIDTAKGIAVVTNQNSNDITLINLASPNPPVGFICTGTVGATLSATETNSCPAA